MNNRMAKLALLAGLMSGYAADKIYHGEGMYTSTEGEEKKPREFTDDEKKRIKADYEAQFHVYVVHGKEIKARSMTDAKRIYNHLNKKKK